MINSKVTKNRFVETRIAGILKITLSVLAITILLALSISLYSGCGAVPTAPLPSNEKTANEIAASKPNLPEPVATGITTGYIKPDKVVNVGRPLSFTISASDVDNDTLQYSATELPDGASFDAGTHTFSWTPRYDQAGDYTIHFEVSDGELTDSEDVRITVVQQYQDWDINGDGIGNVLDIVLVGQHWSEAGLTGWIREDANEDGTINVLDIIVIGQHWSN